MTSLQLLLWIAASILLQMAIYLGISFWRHWADYLALRQKVGKLDIDVSGKDASDDHQMAPPAWSGWRPFKISGKVLEDQSASIYSFELVPQDGQPLPPFLPGQYLTFCLDIATSNGAMEQVMRCYSLSDAPNPGHYRVSIKRIPAPIGSTRHPGLASTYFHDQVQIGSVLKVRAPAGHFCIDPGKDPIVLIAGGIGITPLLSMLNWCLSQKPEREVWLFHGVRHSQELVMTTQLQDLARAHPNFHLHLCLSAATAQDREGQGYQHHGRVDLDLLRRLLPLKPYHFYVCGPTPMLQNLVPALEDWGVPAARIHFEAFGPASIRRKKSLSTAAAPVQDDAITAGSLIVTFAKSGKQSLWQGDSSSLLDFAESKGITVTSGCRAGGCGSCQTTILAGEVAYRQSPDFDPEPGTCLLCVSTPQTSVTLDA
jgi:hypothetical protein